MAKQLKDILKQAHDAIKGVRNSTTEPLSIGKDPGVDYKPKAGDEADFVAKHSVQKWDEPYGNPNYADKVGHVLKKPEEKRHGNTEAKAKAANEEVQKEGYIPPSKPTLTRDDLEKLKKVADMMSKEKTQRNAKKANKTNEETDVVEAWTVTHSNGSVTTHSGASDALKASRKSPGSKVGATHGAMGQKAHDVLSPHQKSDYGTFSAGGYTPPQKKVKEEAEQVDEISKKTLGNYVKSAANDIANRQYRLGKGDLSDTRRLMNRRKGVDKAVNKIVNEKVEQIDELSSKTYKSAMNKAAKKAMRDPQGEGGPQYKKYATMARKFQKKGMEQERKEKTVKEEVIDEVITKKTSAGEFIKDFQQSENPKFAGKSKEKRKQMALAAFYAKQNEEVTEDLAVPLLGGDQPPRGYSDEAAEMVKAELRALANKAMHLVMSMPDSMHVEPWCQAKIATAKELVSGVHDYMVYGDHDKPEEDEQADKQVTFPNMSVDVNTGQNV